ncbi:hypothetical protein LEMLEM_LOCUS23514 [Lemmus lemmus]
MPADLDSGTFPVLPYWPLEPGALPFGHQVNRQQVGVGAGGRGTYSMAGWLLETVLLGTTEGSSQKVVAGDHSLCPCSCNNHSDVCDLETGQCLVLQAIMASLVQQVAAARSVTVTPKALSTMTLTTHLGNVFAVQEPQDSAVRNAGRDTS